MIVNWRKWGFGFSFEFDDPAFLRLWIGPLRVGWKAVWRTEEPSDDEGLEPIETSPLTEREPDL